MNSTSNSSSNTTLKPSLLQKCIPVFAALLCAVGIAAYCCLPAGSFVIVLLVVCFCLLFRALPLPSSRLCGSSAVLASLYSILLAVGGYEDYATSSYAVLRALAVIEVLLGMFVLLYYLIEQLIAFHLRCKPLSAKQHYGYSERRVFLFLFLLCLLCYLPYYLALFPGRLSGDSVKQIQQAYGALPFNNEHPIIHTMMINVLCHIGTSLFGTINAGVAVYSFVQMVLAALVYAYTLTVLYRFGASRLWLLLGIGFYMLLLYNPWYSLTMWKDVPFALLMLLLTVRLFIMLRSPDNLRKRDWVIYILIGIALCLFRHSGLIAFVLTSPALLIAFRKKLRPALIATIGVIATAYLFYVPIYDSLGWESSGPYEALSIPLQQISRVYYEGREISPEDDALLSALADTSYLSEIYVEYISDPVKIHFNDSGNAQVLTENIGAYAALWLRLGRQYPDTYLRAYVHQTRNFWYPCTQHADRAVNTWTAGSKIGIHPQSLMPHGVQSRLIDISRQHARFPIYGHLYSIGLYAFVLLFCLFLAKRKRLSLVPLLPVFWNHLFVLIGTPVMDEFRYAYNLLITVPFLLIAVCTVSHESERSPDISTHF